MTQTRTGRPLGNCTEACVASLLGVSLDEVPDLYDPADLERATTWPRLVTWLRDRGVTWVWVNAPPPAAFELLREHFPTFTPSHHMLGGLNAAGVGHMVVGLDGAMVWDPNPSRAGLASVEDVTFLVPLEHVPEHLRGEPVLCVQPVAA